MPVLDILTFDPKTHTYSGNVCSKYTPVTTKIQEFVPPFDEDYWAQYTANKRGISKAEVLAEWKFTRESACYKGNVVHGNLEDSVNSAAIGFREYLGNRPSIPVNPIWGFELDLDILKQSILGIKYPKILQVIEGYVERGWKVYAEKRVYLAEYGVAGTIDLLVVKGNEFIIIDWKTNKDILRFVAGYYKKKNNVRTGEFIQTNDKLLGPLKHLPNCKGSIYTLQLSLYAYLTEAWGYVCKGLILFHILETSAQEAAAPVLSRAPIYPYNITYLKDEIGKMLISRKPKRAPNLSITTTRKAPQKFPKGRFGIV